jgi:predicted esterase
MTKDDRLIDIANQSRYLNQLHQHVLGSSQAKVTVIGFSQGAATASRWALATDARINNLVLWSSAFPPDLPAMDSSLNRNKLSVYQFIGTEDPYLKGGEGDVLSKFLSPPGLETELFAFNGGHEIRPSELEILADRILS